MAHASRRQNSPAHRIQRQESRTLSIKRQPSPCDEARANFYPKSYGNVQVQQSDGHFFESFTALTWKQENRRLRASSESEREADQPPPSESRLGPRPRIHRLHKKEFELLYIEVLYTIKHKIGTTSGGHSPFIQDLYLYAREAFGVSPEDHARLLAKASEEKPPILILNICVKEGRDLEAKDADGYSDPYCMLGIMPARRESREGSFSSDDEAKPRRDDKKPGALKKFSQSFKKRKDKSTARDALPAKYIKSTKVIPNTLNPLWNEKFRFDLDDVYTDRLHLDIWDHDDESSVFDAAKRLNEVSGFKGLGRFFKQVAQSARTSSSANVDDFLGSVNIRLDDIPSTGLDKWFDLEGRSQRSNVQGQIRMKLSLATREDRGIPEEDNWTDVKQHEDLMCIFIEHEIRKFKVRNSSRRQVQGRIKDDVYKWTGELPQAALTILHQHAIQGDITETQQAMCRWIAYSRRHMEHPFHWGVLLKLQEQLEAIWAPESFTRDEEESLADAFNLFITYCLGLIANQREIYPPANRTAYKRLELLLRCLAKVYHMKVFKQCCPFQKEIYAEIPAVLKKSSTDWYEKMHVTTRPHTQADEDTIHSLVELTNVLNTDLQQALQYYQSLYDSLVNISYFSVVYRQLEKLLDEDLSQELATVTSLQSSPSVDSGNLAAQQMGTQLFELYMALQEFCKFRDNLTHSDRRNLAITRYYEWFRSPVEKWLTISKHKLIQRIRKSVDTDKVELVDGNIKQSTSAVDVCCCFGQILGFWQQLSWPDPFTALPLVSKITEDLCEGARLYADLIHEKLKAAGYYDEVGQFDVTEQLCITINDIEQVRRALRPIPETLRFGEIAHAVDRQQGEKAARDCKAGLISIVRSSDDCMVQKIKSVVDRVADKMRPDIKKDVFHLCWSPESLPVDEAISDLMEYLDSNLLTLNNNLLRANFDRILDSIWVEVLEEIIHVVDNEEVKNTAFYERLYDALEILVDFFHANEKGLPLNKIRSKMYRTVHTRLRLHKAETQEIIQIYYKEKLEEQEKYEECEFGVLNVRVYYNVDAEILYVEVLNAKNIIPLDTNGLSDPYVMIELCPRHIFPSQSEQQTEIVKKTLNPVFDEAFEFSVSVEQCRQEGACILFTVMDHDFIMSNDFAGEAFLSLNSIPGVSGEEISGFTALNPIDLCLTQPKRGQYTPAKGVLSALETRDWDTEAQEFVKKRKQVQSLAVR